MRRSKLGLKAVAAAAMALGAAAVYAAGATAYKGQGLNSNPDGFGNYDLNLEICGVQNGADADGPYLLWVFSGTGSKTATITGPWGTVPMTQAGNGTLKYVSAWYDPNTLLPSVVSASGDGKKSGQLVVSHGCRPYRKGGWCSPGFWKNADDAAWALVGTSRNDTFNSVVVPNFYDTANGDDTLTLWSVLTYTGAAGANHYGPESLPYGLNPPNATAAALTNRIAGYQFDNASKQTQDAGGSDQCPIDNHGDYKTPQ